MIFLLRSELVSYQVISEAPLSCESVNILASINGIAVFFVKVKFAHRNISVPMLDW
jgi:hypothetical protein